MCDGFFFLNWST